MYMYSYGPKACGGCCSSETVCPDGRRGLISEMLSRSPQKSQHVRNRLHDDEYIFGYLIHCLCLSCCITLKRGMQSERLGLNVSLSDSRAKESRREMIRDQIETMLNMKGKTPPLPMDVLNDTQIDEALRNSWEDVVQDQPDSGLYSDYTEKLQSMYPSCLVPKPVKNHVPKDPHMAHLFFKVRHIHPGHGRDLRFLSAKLKLFYMGPQNEDEPDLRPDFYRGIGEDKIRVTVSWIKRNKSRGMKEHLMLDSVMVNRSASQWLEFNVMDALLHWNQSPRRNFGFLVEVEDAQLNRRDPSKYIQTTTCTHSDDQEEPSMALPSALRRIVESTEDPIQHPLSHHGRLLNSKRNPVLDVASIELPHGEEVPMQIPVLNFSSLMEIQAAHERAQGSALPILTPEEKRDILQDFIAGQETSTVETPNFHSAEEDSSASFHAQVSGAEDPLYDDYGDGGFLMDFPVFSSHVNIHNVNNPAQDPQPKPPSEYNTLEIMDEIRYRNPDQPSRSHPNPHSSPNHWPAFQPTVKKVLMTQSELIRKLQEVLAHEGDEIEAEKAYLDSLLQSY